MSVIEALFSEKIEPNLAPLEGYRKKVQRSYIIFILAFVAAIIFGGIMVAKQNPWFMIPVAAIFIFMAIIGVKAYRQKKEYRAVFKNTVIAELVKRVNPTWSYDPDKMINPEIYVHSNLFTEPFDRYNGDDFVSGVIEKTDFECSELHTEYKEVRYNNKGQREEHWVTIFKGLFFHADFNKNFNGSTFVLPDFSEKIFGKFGQIFQKIMGPYQLVKLENIDFEKKFVVYSTDQIEARYILTPTIMEAILRISYLHNYTVRFAFVGSRVYCALSISKDLFEPKIFSKAINLKDAESMYNLLKLNEIIIQELNLNTRIWTKL